VPFAARFAALLLKEKVEFPEPDAVARSSRPAWRQGFLRAAERFFGGPEHPGLCREAATFSGLAEGFPAGFGFGGVLSALFPFCLFLSIFDLLFQPCLASGLFFGLFHCIFTLFRFLCCLLLTFVNVLS
jgi:hypothetical protein